MFANPCSESTQIIVCWIYCTDWNNTVYWLMNYRKLFHNFWRTFFSPSKSKSVIYGPKCKPISWILSSMTQRNQRNDMRVEESNRYPNGIEWTTWFEWMFSVLSSQGCIHWNTNGLIVPTIKERYLLVKVLILSMSSLIIHDEKMNGEGIVAKTQEMKIR